MHKDNLSILNQAELLYRVKFVHENTMGGSGNRIFEVQQESMPFILRASEYSLINEYHIKLELNWMAYLSQHMKGIVKPIKSVNNRLYEIISVNENSYILYLMEKATGKIVNSDNPMEFNETLYFNLGALMGGMHRLTIDYAGNTVNPYFVWDNDTYSWRGKYPISDDDVRISESNYKNELNTLPITKESYGIIHYDIHTDNFFVDNDKITLFDFDACQFNFYAADIASALFFMVQKGVNPLKHKNEKERTEFAETFLISYLKGYTQTNILSDYWIFALDLFLKYQMIDEFRCAQNSMKDALGTQQEWYLNWYRDRIIHNRSYVTLDYKKIIRSIPTIQRK